MKKKASQPEPNAADVAEAAEKGKSKAAEYLKDPSKAKRLAKAAMEKARSFGKDKGPLGEVWEYLMALIYLLEAYVHGEYKDIPWGSIVLVMVAIIYFVSPIDLIPDFIPVAGYVDDAAVIAFVIAQIKADLDNFIAWKKRRESDPM